MNVYSKSYWSIVLSCALVYLFSAENAYSQEGDASSGGNWSQEYHDGDWRKNLTLSFGVDALRSNSDFSSDKNSVSLSSDPKWGFGVMTSLELGLADYAGVAIGLHYLHRRF